MSNRYKIIFLKKDDEEELCISQFKVYVLKDKESLVYKLCKILYGLKYLL